MRPEIQKYLDNRSQFDDQWDIQLEARDPSQFTINLNGNRFLATTEIKTYLLVLLRKKMRALAAQPPATEHIDTLLDICFDCIDEIRNTKHVMEIEKAQALFKRKDPNNRLDLLKLLPTVDVINNQDLTSDYITKILDNAQTIVSAQHDQEQAEMTAFEIKSHAQSTMASQIPVEASAKISEIRANTIVREEAYRQKFIEIEQQKELFAQKQKDYQPLKDRHDLLLEAYKLTAPLLITTDSIQAALSALTTEQQNLPPRILGRLTAHTIETGKDLSSSFFSFKKSESWQTRLKAAITADYQIITAYLRELTTQISQYDALMVEINFLTATIQQIEKQLIEQRVPSEDKVELQSKLSRFQDLLQAKQQALRIPETQSPLEAKKKAIQSQIEQSNQLLQECYAQDEKEKLTLENLSQELASLKMIITLEDLPQSKRAALTQQSRELEQQIAGAQQNIARLQQTLMTHTNAIIRQQEALEQITQEYDNTIATLTSSIEACQRLLRSYHNFSKAFDVESAKQFCETRNIPFDLAEINKQLRDIEQKLTALDEENNQGIYQQFDTPELLEQQRQKAGENDEQKIDEILCSMTEETAAIGESLKQEREKINGIRTANKNNWTSFITNLTTLHDLLVAKERETDVLDFEMPADETVAAAAAAATSTPAKLPAGRRFDSRYVKGDKDFAYKDTMDDEFAEPSQSAARASTLSTSATLAAINRHSTIRHISESIAQPQRGQAPSPTPSTWARQSPTHSALDTQATTVELKDFNAHDETGDDPIPMTPLSREGSGHSTPRPRSGLGTSV